MPSSLNQYLRLIRLKSASASEVFCSESQGCRAWAKASQFPAAEPAQLEATRNEMVGVGVEVGVEVTVGVIVQVPVPVGLEVGVADGLEVRVRVTLGVLERVKVGVEVVSVKSMQPFKL